jgi:hypothetical protein
MNTEQLFNKRILNFESRIIKDGIITVFDHYVNLDNAATTPPLKIVEKKSQSFSCKLRLCA